ncbi:hypothetical protein FOZ62_026068 [Perkinsus olseni]|uniref:Uncharacterized protein n=1 Tax=Perkinsus olseni TaxID=32597 RepID=A0A7J6T648_PEROL|nr:hypothetical protein FOZ62_026068 [Perkinsus olseni]
MVNVWRTSVEADFKSVEYREKPDGNAWLEYWNGEIAGTIEGSADDIKITFAEVFPFPDIMDDLKKGIDGITNDRVTSGVSRSLVSRASASSRIHKEASFQLRLRFGRPNIAVKKNLGGNRRSRCSERFIRSKTGFLAWPGWPSLQINRTRSLLLAESAVAESLPMANDSLVVVGLEGYRNIQVLKMDESRAAIRASPSAALVKPAEKMGLPRRLVALYSPLAPRALTLSRDLHPIPHKAQTRQVCLIK